MSQIPTQNDDDTRSVAASDFVQLDQPEEVPDQQEEEQQQPQFGFHQNLLDWTMHTDTGIPNNYGNDLKELKLMIVNLEAKNQTLQANNQTLQKALENLELKAENRALKENAEQKANYQALETQFAKMLSTQNEEYHKEMDQLKDGFAKMLSTQNEQQHKQLAQLKSKNQKLEEKLSAVELQTKGTTENEALETKFAKMLSTHTEQHQKQLAQLESTNRKLEEKLSNVGKEMATRNAEHKKKIADLEAENWELNVYFAKEIISLRGQLEEKINWNQVDLVMGKKLVSPIAIPIENRWDLAKAKTKDYISISADGLTANSNSDANGWQSVYAAKGFIISVDSGPLLYYFEITHKYYHPNIWRSRIGLSTGNIPDDKYVGRLANSYAVPFGRGDDYCWLSGKKHKIDWLKDATDLGWDGTADVVGCGLLQSPEKGLSIFLTANGTLIGKPIPIDSTADLLYPTVSLYKKISVEVNFGDDSAKPFSYDIKKCPGMVFN